MSMLKKSPREELEKEVHHLLDYVADMHKGRHVKAMLAIIISFLLSAWLTSKGLYDKAIEAGVATPEGMTTAFLSAIVAATLIGVGTTILFSLAISATKRHSWMVGLLAITLFPFIAGISILNAVIGNAGPPSLVYDMRDLGNDYRQHYEEASSDSSSAQSAAAALKPLQTSLCTLAGVEKDRGGLTGAGGAGAVSAAYESTCRSIAVIIETLEETRSSAITRRDLAFGILQELKDIPEDTSLDVFERQAAFKRAVSELMALVDQTRAEKVVDRLKTQLQIAHASVASLGLKDGAYGRKQSDSIENLKTSLELTSRIVGDLLDKDKALPATPPRNMRSMGAAVVAYWDRSLSQILIAVLGDTMVFWLLAAMLLSRGITEKETRRLKAQRTRLQRASRNNDTHEGESQ